MRHTRLSMRWHAVWPQVRHDVALEHLRERLHEPRAVLVVAPREEAWYDRIGHEEVCLNWNPIE